MNSLKTGCAINSKIIINVTSRCCKTQRQKINWTVPCDFLLIPDVLVHEKPPQRLFVCWPQKTHPHWRAELSHDKWLIPNFPWLQMKNLVWLSCLKINLLGIDLKLRYKLLVYICSTTIWVNNHHKMPLL